jgi:hypothetical protein
MDNQQNDNVPPVDPELARLEKLAKILDNQFRVPGTQFRFGLDGIIGLVPYLGDLAGFAVSGILLRTMVKKGAGPLLMLRMMWNFVLDAVIGIIPVVGDLFDFGYKANRRNVNLLKQYYADGKAKPSAKGSMLVLALLFMLVLAGIIWLIWTFTAMLVGWVFSMLRLL